jgi:hypothetical protein
LLPELAAVVGEVADGAVFVVAAVFAGVPPDALLAGTGFAELPAGGLLVGLTIVVVFAELFAAGDEAGGVEEAGVEEDAVEDDGAAGALVTCVVRFEVSVPEIDVLLVELLPPPGLLAGVAVWLCAGCALVAVGAAFDCALEAAAAARSWFHTASLPPFSRYLRKESLAICCSLGVPLARLTALASNQYASALLPLLPERIACAKP